MNKKQVVELAQQVVLDCPLVQIALEGRYRLRVHHPIIGHSVTLSRPLPGGFDDWLLTPLRQMVEKVGNIPAQCETCHDVLTEVMADDLGKEFQRGFFPYCENCIGTANIKP